MKFSIVTPSFNQAQYIDRTIESVVNQQGDFQIQYIVMDAVSSDGTIDILKKWEFELRVNPRVEFIWVSEPDKGQADAINKGLQIANGDVLAYLNSDDTYAPGAFQNIQRFFENHPQIGFVYGKCRIIDENDREIRKFIKHYRTWLGRTYSYSKLLRENFVPQPATFWRARVLRESGYFNTGENLCLDYEYWCRIGQRFEGAFVDAYLASFRWYPSSKSGAQFGKQFRDELRIAKHYAAGKHRLSLLVHEFNYWKITTAYRVLRTLGI